MTPKLSSPGKQKKNNSYLKQSNTTNNDIELGITTKKQDYKINEKRYIKEALETLKRLNIPLNKPCRYEPHIIIGQEKGKKLPNPQDHEPRHEIEKLENKESYVEVESIMSGEFDPQKPTNQEFPTPLPKLP